MKTIFIVKVVGKNHETCSDIAFSTKEEALKYANTLEATLNSMNLLKGKEVVVKSAYFVD